MVELWPLRNSQCLAIYQYHFVMELNGIHSGFIWVPAVLCVFPSIFHSQSAALMLPVEWHFITVLIWNCLLIMVDISRLSSSPHLLRWDICSGLLPSFSVGWLLFYCWVLSVLSIFQMQAVYQLWALQTFPQKFALLFDFLNCDFWQSRCC